MKVHTKHLDLRAEKKLELHSQQVTIASGQKSKKYSEVAKFCAKTTPCHSSIL